MGKLGRNWWLTGTNGKDIKTERLSRKAQLNNISCSLLLFTSLIFWRPGWGQWRENTQLAHRGSSFPPGQRTRTTLGLWPLRWPASLQTTMSLKVTIKPSILTLHLINYQSKTVGIQRQGMQLSSELWRSRKAKILRRTSSAQSPPNTFCLGPVKWHEGWSISPQRRCRRN